MVLLRGSGGGSGIKLFGFTAGKEALGGASFFVCRSAVPGVTRIIVRVCSASDGVTPGQNSTIVREYPVFSGFGVGVSGFGLLNRGRAAALAAALPGITSTIVLVFCLLLALLLVIFCYFFIKICIIVLVFCTKKHILICISKVLILTKTEKDENYDYINKRISYLWC